MPTHYADGTPVAASNQRPAAAMTASKKGFQKKTSSFNAVVADLDVGEYASRVFPLPGCIAVSDIPDEMRTIKRQAQDNVKDAVRRAKAETGGSYSVAVSETFTPGGEPFVVLIIQRTE